MLRIHTVRPMAFGPRRSKATYFPSGQTAGDRTGLLVPLGVQPEGPTLRQH